MIHSTPWSCGLICHVLDRKVEGSNLVAAKIFFNSLSGSQRRKKGTCSLIASVRAVAVGEEEETRRESESSGGIIRSINLMWWGHLTVFV